MQIEPGFYESRTLDAHVQLAQPQANAGVWTMEGRIMVAETRNTMGEQQSLGTRTI